MERSPAATLVFRDYDQAALDAAYDQRLHAPNQEHVAARNVANSDLARSRIGEPQLAAYGPTPPEYVEIYPAAAPNAPIFVFVHGGAWRSTGTRRYGFAAETFVSAGVHFVAVQFAGVETVDGDLRTPVEQIRRAVAWVYRNAATFGGDPERITIGGHSSGAHLVSVVLTTDWPSYGVPAGVLHAALCCSGMYDLEAVSRSKRSTYVRFDDALVDAFSAIRHIDRITVPVLVAYGTCESPEFQRLGAEFAAALRAAGKLAGTIVGTGYNHFELIETIGNPHGLIGRAALDLVRR